MLILELLRRERISYFISLIIVLALYIYVYVYISTVVIYELYAIGYNVLLNIVKLI